MNHNWKLYTYINKVCIYIHEYAYKIKHLLSNLHNQIYFEIN